MRNKIAVLGLSVAAAVALACGAGGDNNNGGGDNAGSGSTATGGNDQPAEKVAKIGQPARDGKFEFTVKQVKCGVAKVGSDFLNDKAQGQFCLITVTVKNIGKEAQLLDGSSQKGYTADGKEYSTDSEAGLYANQEQSTFFNEINPGNQVTGVLVFDIPKNVKLTKLELHDSAFSGGVAVQLG
jgi:Domain of unknown function (DUF4352)